MATSMAEQLGALPLVSTVLRVDFDLLEASSSFTESQQILIGWGGRKATDFGQAIDWKKPSFKIESANFSFEYASSEDTFTFFLSHKEGPAGFGSRDWITEVSLLRKDLGVRFTTRLSIRQPRDAQQPIPRAPRFVADLVDRVGARDVQFLSLQPLDFHGANFEDFDTLLLSEKRTLPILAISEDKELGDSRIDSAKLSSLLAGIAHVAVLNPVASWMLTQKYGKERSTFRGAVRCYNPGFSSGADPFQNKLWLREAINRQNAFRSNGFLNQCVSHLFAVATAQFAPYSFITPSALKRKESEPQPLVLSSPVDSTQEQLQFDEIFLVDADQPIRKELISVDRTEEGQSAYILDLRLADAIKNLGEKADFEIQSKQDEIYRLEKELLEARDETAQKSQELTLLRPFQQEVALLTEELGILRGDYDDKKSPVVKDFWDGFNMFVETAKNLVSQAQRADQQERESWRA